MLTDKEKQVLVRRVIHHKTRVEVGWSSNFFQIGRTYGTSNYMDGYLAEIVYIDGTRLDPSSFGEYNSFWDMDSQRR